MQSKIRRSESSRCSSSQAPELHFAIGQCHRYLRQFEKALFHYRRYLDEVENPDKKEETEHLIRLSEEALQPSTPTRAPPVDIPDPPRATGPAERVQDPGSNRVRTTLLWTGVGLTAALLVTGTISMSVAYSKSERFKDRETPGHELQDLQDSGEALRAAGLTTLILGAVVGTATTVYYFLGRPSKQTAAIAPLPRGGMLVWNGRF